MITQEMIKRGYEAGIVKLMESPNGDGVVCGIGDNWFYFGGETAEASTVEGFRKDVPAEDIIKEIFRVLEDFRRDGDVFEDEYLYYEAFLDEQLMDLASSLTAKTAADFVRENPILAGEIYRIVEHENLRRDIIDRLKNHEDIDASSLTDEEIDSMTARFEFGLSHNDNYWDDYWASADVAIKEIVSEKAKGEDANALGWNSVEEMVDKALASIRGVGVDMGSGYYGLREFEVDGESMELVVEVCRFEEEAENEAYYGVYYWVGYYDGDSLFTDWKYTSSLDVDELKAVVHELGNTDFTEDIRKEMNKGNIEAVISDATGRFAAKNSTESKTQEYVKY